LGAAILGDANRALWARLQKCSTDTALRDITGLMARGMLHRDDSGGRSTRYSLAFPDPAGTTD
jgi:Fic family protein